MDNTYNRQENTAMNQREMNELRRILRAKCDEAQTFAREYRAIQPQTKSTMLDAEFWTGQQCGMRSALNIVTNWCDDQLAPE